MKLGIAIMVILLAGCGTIPTTANYEEILKTFTGLTEDELVAQWGPPDSVYTTGATKYLTYQKRVSGYIPGMAPSYQSTVIGNTVTTQAIGGYPGYNFTRSCKTSFAITAGRITSWRYEGNGCKAREQSTVVQP